MAVGNVRQWLDQSDIDYFTHFVKAWIPFNAWYREHYGPSANERDILEQVKSDGNRMRTRVKAQIAAEGADADELRNYIAALHRRLSTDPLADRRGRRISFESVCIGRNASTTESQTKYGWSYDVRRETNPKQLVCVITDKAGVVRANIIQAGEWNLEDFRLLAGVQALHRNKQSILLACYTRANPYSFRSLLADASQRTPIEMDGYRFINDEEAIFAGLIDVLYGMRNLLFHGELVPDSQANRTYEPAYHLLRYFLRAIA